MFDMETAKNLLQELKLRRCAIFAGAGVGIEAGLPCWKTALQQLADHISKFDQNIKGIMFDRIEKQKYLDAAQFYYMADTEQHNIIKGVELVFGKKPQITQNIEALMKLHIKHFITTNYDQTIEDAWAHLKKEYIPSLQNIRENFLAAHRLLNQERDFVIHIHGTILVPTNIVLAKSHYDKVIKIEEYFQFLRHILMNRSLIFIGFSFNDPALQAFLEYTKEKLQLICEKSSFAFISIKDKDRIEFLRNSGITPLCYDSSNNHSGLWMLIKWLKDELAKSDSSMEITYDSKNEEILKLKHNLASIYTHFKIRRRHQNVYDSIIDGIVHFLGWSIEKRGDSATVDLISDELSRFLHIDKKRALLITNNSIGSLVLNSYASRMNEHYTFTPSDTKINDDLIVLVKSIRDRAKLRYSREFLFQDEEICEFILLVLVIDGVRLAHSILTNFPLPDSSLDEILARSYYIIFKEENINKDYFLSAVRSLFTSPNSREAEILGTISRIAFLTDLSLHEPDLTSLNIKKQFYRVALDASVLLPALCKYHPRFNFYRSIIRKAQDYGIKITVTAGFLEEVVIHRQKAIEAFDREFRSHEKRFKDYVLLYGSDNINVFLGGFSGWLTTKNDYDFQKYLKESAPFTNIKELSIYLENQGIFTENPVSELSLEAGRISLWNSSLKDWYRDRRKSKAKSLVWHEAIQLETLSKVKSLDKAYAFLTADKNFIYAVCDISSKRYLDQSVLYFLVMPIQFSYYIDLDEERKIDWKAYSKILWSKSFTEYHVKFTEYFIDKILHEYEPKLVQSVPKIIGEVQDEIEKSRAFKDTMYKDDEIKIKEFKYIEDFDEKFYAIMHEESKKFGLK